jgi:Fe-S cluster assembly scaffold protein SufB
MNVSESSIDIGEIVSGLVLNLSALGRNNSEPNKDSWVYNDVTTTFNNFAWGNADGWIDGALLINEGRSISIDYNMFALDAMSTGKTIEIEYEVCNIVNQDAVLLSCLDVAGLQITSSKALISSRSGMSVETRFSPNERIRITFVINRSENVTNKKLIFIGQRRLRANIGFK